jgi:hypothetical protein
MSRVGVALGREDGEHLETVAVVDLGDRLQDEIRELGLADVLLVDHVEDAPEVETARCQEQRGVVMQAARPVVPQFDACDVDAQAGTRCRAAADDVELQQRAGAAGIRGAPATRRKLRALDRVGGEDREAAAATDVFFLAQRLVEVHHLVEGQAVDEDQVVPRPAAAHGEIGEVAGGDQAGQAVERAHDVTARAHGAAKLFAVEEGRAGSPEGVCLYRARHHDDLVEALVDGQHLETHRRRAARAALSAYRPGSSGVTRTTPSRLVVAVDDSPSLAVIATSTPSRARRVSALTIRTSIPVSLATACDTGPVPNPHRAAARQALITIFSWFSPPPRPQRLAKASECRVTAS